MNRFVFLLLLLFCFHGLFAQAPDSVISMAAHYEVLIDEFMPDASPPVGLPAYSFIELRNISGRAFNLRNWKISTGGSTATIKKDLLLGPDSLLILCSTTAEAAYRAFGNAFGVTSFPSLNHDAGEIILENADSSVVHAIQYDKSWYHNELKSAGGWSLEMIDPHNPCSGSFNWTASLAPAGGTPGAVNSVAGTNPDDEAPELIRCLVPDSLHLLLLFNEPMDSLTATNTFNYRLQPEGVQITGAVPVAPFYDKVMLELDRPLPTEQVFEVTVNGVTDCSGQLIGLRNTCLAGLPQSAAPGDLIFNEILFNPAPYGSDYIEIYNRSRKTIDLQRIFLASRDDAGNVKDPKAIQTDSYLFFPGEYAVATEDTAWVFRNYLVMHPEKLFYCSAMPSMPDDEGKVLLLDNTGQLLDELDYDHHWHSPLLADEEGVALERMRTEEPTNLADNWTSAAADAGYGTPTEKNSESFPDSSGGEEISVVPKIFSPDNDGYQDFCFVKYHLTQPGFIANVVVYDIAGRLVRMLANNETLSTDGQFRWDGLDDRSNQLSTGHYVICITLYNLAGRVKSFKRVAVLARRTG